MRPRKPPISFAVIVPMQFGLTVLGSLTESLTPYVHPDSAAILGLRYIILSVRRSLSLGDILPPANLTSAASFPRLLPVFSLVVEKILLLNSFRTEQERYRTRIPSRSSVLLSVLPKNPFAL